MAGKIKETGGFTQKAVVRVGLLLSVVVVLFAFGRQMAIPSSYGEYGRYRGNNVSEVVSKSANYAGGGSATCRDCHQSQYQAVIQKEHGGFDCQTCHGPAANHVKKPKEFSPKVEADAELCGSCHRQITGRDDAKIATIRIDSHSGGVACGRCHNPHQPRAGLGGSN